MMSAVRRRGALPIIVYFCWGRAEKTCKLSCQIKLLFFRFLSFLLFLGRACRSLKVYMYMFSVAQNYFWGYTRPFWHSVHQKLRKMVHLAPNKTPGTFLTLPGAQKTQKDDKRNCRTSFLTFRLFDRILTYIQPFSVILSFFCMVFYAESD